MGGWLSEKDRLFFDEQVAKIDAAGLTDRFRHLEAPDGAAKLEFLKGIDLFTVPARFVEPKGIYVFEAMACGLPVVAPSRGAFPEMINASGGGLLCAAEDPSDLAAKLSELIADPAAALRHGISGRAWVERFNDRRSMAEATAGVFDRVLAERQQG